MSTPPDPLAALRSEVEQERAAVADARSEAHTLGKLARETLREACQDPDLTPLERADVAFKLARSVDALARHTLDRARRADTLAALSWELPLLPDGLGEHTPASVLWALARGDLPAPPEARAAAAAQLAKLRAARQAQADTSRESEDFWAQYQGKGTSLTELRREWLEPGYNGADRPKPAPAPEPEPSPEPEPADTLAALRARHFGAPEPAPAPAPRGEAPPDGRDLRPGPLR